MNDELRQRTRRALDELRLELLGARSDGGHWVGQLSASALSTATAISAIATMIGQSAGTDDDAAARMIDGGIEYLRGEQNVDGGFGDTDRSHSNIATSYLVLAASTLGAIAGRDRLSNDSVARLRNYIDHQGGIDGLRRRYGTDKTFVIPIMTNMAIAGLIDWDDVAPLPFEAAVVPQSMYRFLQMPVVSYAIPALVAIGQTRHFYGKKTFLPWRLVRATSIAPTMKVLQKMQPESGGYLEATPLTSFVVMSLAATGRASHVVCQNGFRFLTNSVLSDGSWPIDTNLATWVTSLAIEALASDPEDDGVWYDEALVRWHLSCQHRVRHPFTGAEPGGWGWTDLSGAVPDSDDTPGAMLALDRMRRWCESDSLKSEIDEASRQGQRWLLKLQNRNGGWPTFCRGWGKLPFDKSSTDLTAHAIRALSLGTLADSKSAIGRGRDFLRRSQQHDGSWLPLWFGNQDRDAEDNPIYGTAKVLMAGEAGSIGGREIAKAVEYLVASQNDDGGWGGGVSVAAFWAATDPDGESARSTVEETALAVDALSQFGRDSTHAGNDRLDQAILSGVEFLLLSVERRRHRVAWPIGFYFAKLWYHERLYPLIFTIAALGRVLQRSFPSHPSVSQHDSCQR